MGKTFDFDEADRLVNEQYGPLTITIDGEPVRLLHLLALPKERRRQVSALYKAAEAEVASGEADDVDVDKATDATDLYRSLIELVCQTPAQWKLLKDKVGDNDAWYSWAAGEWTQATSAGEAKASED